MADPHGLPLTFTASWHQQEATAQLALDTTKSTQDLAAEGASAYESVL